jgi:murein L,D-transpeptidase YcbB/YkuD
VLDQLAQTVAQHGVNTASLKSLTTPPAAESVTAQTERTDRLALRLAAIFGQGAVAPSIADRAWHIPVSATKPSVEALRSLAAPDLKAQIAALAPQSPTYRFLQAELANQLAQPPTELTQSRIIRLRATLERWRWLPRDFPPDRVEVHGPQFELRLFRNNQRIATHKVIIGAPRTPTPSFATAITGVTLNPMWRPPAAIARQEILPLMVRDPSRAAALGYRFVDSHGSLREPGDRRLAAKASLRIVQLPGASNALGRVKLEMSNPFAIYVHDTPAQALFNREIRAFSHGCIRVENARDLAALLLDPHVWPRSALDASIENGPTQTLSLPVEMPISVLYLTAQPDQDGVVQYSADLDGRDQRLVHMLDAPDTVKAASASRNEHVSECWTPSAR